MGAAEQDSLEQELAMMAEHINNLIRENAQVAQDQREFLKKEEKLRSFYRETGRKVVYFGCSKIGISGMIKTAGGEAI